MPDLGDLKSERHSRSRDDAGNRNLVITVYALQAISTLVGFTIFIALIINYVKREDVEGTIAASHFRWQIRTFWFGLLWLTIGYITTLFLLGYLVFFAASLWFVYRIIKGWLRIYENRPMYTG